MTISSLFYYVKYDQFDVHTEQFSYFSTNDSNSYASQVQVLD